MIGEWIFGIYKVNNKLSSNLFIYLRSLLFSIQNVFFVLVSCRNCFSSWLGFVRNVSVLFFFIRINFKSPLNVLTCWWINLNPDVNHMLVTLKTIPKFCKTSSQISRGFFAILHNQGLFFQFTKYDPSLNLENEIWTVETAKQEKSDPKSQFF